MAHIELPPDAGRAQDLSGAGSVFKNRGFVYLWSAQALSQLASNMVLAALIATVVTTTGSLTANAVLILTFLVPAVLFSTLGGILVERGDAKVIMLATNVFRALGTILKAAPDTRAIFFTGDVLAAGALLECQRRGIDVPSQLAIAASDDTEWLENTVPPVTTIKYPRYGIGVRAAELIIGRTVNPSLGASREDLGFEIARRSST